MSDRVPNFIVGDYVRIMQTDTQERDARSNQLGVIIEVKDAESCRLAFVRIDGYPKSKVCIPFSSLMKA